MSIATDRDLLALEPALFDTFSWGAQQRVSVDDALAVGQEVSSGSVDFAAAGVEAGQIALIGGQPHEVIARVDSHTLTVSRPRGSLSAPSVQGVQGTQLSLVVASFGLQLERMHAQLLRMLGVGVDAGPDAPTEDAIVSQSVLAELEALGTLHQGFVALAAGDSENSFALAKAREYRIRFNQRCRGARVALDRDGDGVADTWVSLGTPELVRA